MNKILLGVDGGGSGCRAAIANERGTILGSSTGGPANIMTDFDSAQKNIVQATRAALSDAELGNTELANIDAVIGVAGANVGNYAERLATSLPFNRSQVENDSAIALRGALQTDDGIVATIGTGSIFVRQHHGKTKTIGGWGNVVGDQASGVWLGKRLLHDTLLCFDGIYPRTPLYTTTMNQFNHSAEAVVTFANDATPGDFAGFAKAVMDSAATADSLANRIVQSAVSDIELILDNMSDHDELPLCLLGSLGPRYADYLSRQFKIRLQKPKGDAVSGAIAMAVERYCC